jgi:hypothetical protein
MTSSSRSSLDLLGSFYSQTAETILGDYGCFRKKQDTIYSLRFVVFSRQYLKTGVSPKNFLAQIGTSQCGENWLDNSGTGRVYRCSAPILQRLED